MFEAENIRDWRNYSVVDPDGHKIGTHEAVYFDTGTDQPSFASIRAGMIGRHRLDFVPLEGALVSPDHVRVAYSRSQVKGVFSIDTDGELGPEEEPKVSDHYGLASQPGARGEPRLPRR